jgi:plastocyanin
MTVRYKNLTFALLAMPAMSLLIFAIVQNANATSSEIRMLTDLNPTNGGIADGRADYRERGNSMRLNVEVEDVSPNSTFTVEISGEAIGTITTSSFGIAELELNTNDGQVVPKILRGDLVQIFQGTELVLSGSFDDDDGNIEDDNPFPITPAQNSAIQAGNSSAITTVITIPQDADELGAAGAYSPNPASISSGSTLTWNNIDDTPHTATADDGSFDTGIINGGSLGSALISASTGTTSTIPYHCNVHPEMRGTLQIISSLSTVPSSNSTLQDTTVTLTNSSATDATIQNLQQELVALQQPVDTLQQALMGLKQDLPQEGNATISSGNNNNDNNNTAISPIQEERELQQQPPLPPLQQPQSQQQQEQHQNKTVSIGLGASSGLTNNTFQPNPIQVSVGATVTWTNDDSQPHTITSGVNGQPDVRFNSSPNFNPLLAPGQTFEHTFTEPGEYPYFCLLHPNMVGTVQRG